MMMQNNWQTKKANQIMNIHISLSREHYKFQEDIRHCFDKLNVDVQSNYIRCSAQQLPMLVIIFLGNSVLSGLTWDLLKLGIENIFGKFKDAGIEIRDQDSIMFAVFPDGKVKAIVTPDRYFEFKKIKNLDDLQIYLRNKKNNPSKKIIVNKDGKFNCKRKKNNQRN